MLRQFERSFDRFLVGTKSKTLYFDFIPLEKHHQNCTQYDVFNHLSSLLSRTQLNYFFIRLDVNHSR